MAGRKQQADIEAVVRDLQDDICTTREVAEKHNIPLKKVHQIANKRDISLRNRIKPHHREIIDTIKSQNLTRKEAAQQCDVSERVVEHACRKYGMKPEMPSHYPLLRDREWLYKQLVEKQRTYQDIAEEVGCTYQRVQQRVNELGWQDKRKRRKRRREE